MRFSLWKLRFVGHCVFFLAPSFCLAALTWNSQRIESTAKTADKQAVGIFRFVNSGKTTITITSVKPDCGCTTAELEKQAYAPGETGEIKAVFAFEGRVGVHEKTIHVTADDDPTKPVTLTLRVNILEPLSCTPRLLLWRTDDEKAEKVVAISANGENRIASFDYKSSPPTNVAVKLETLDAGKKFRLLVQPASITTASQTTIACIATLADGTTYPITIFALVR